MIGDHRKHINPKGNSSYKIIKEKTSNLNNVGNYSIDHAQIRKDC